MIDTELIDAYAALVLRAMRGEIAMVAVDAVLRELLNKAYDAGMSDEQLMCHVASGFMRAMAIADEVHLSPSGRWQ